MIEPDRDMEKDNEAVDRIVLSGARGAVAVAGTAAAVVVILWFAFYLLVFVPRAVAS
jgi:hypothetical protein